MGRLRHILLVSFFGALVALEIAHGIVRLGTLRERNRAALLENVAREHAELARSLRSALARGREHASFLSRVPGVVDAALGTDSELSQRALQELFLPYLVSFRGFDRVLVLDASARERFRCERIGQGVGVLPPCLLAGAHDASLLDLLANAAPGEVAVSDLVIDDQRVEVPEADRQVLHYAVALRREGESAGALVLTTYASELFEPLRRFAPFAGAAALLVDCDGAPTTVWPRPDSAAGVGGSSGEVRVAADGTLAVPRELFTGAAEAHTDEAVFFAITVGDSPPWTLVARVPEEALDAASAHLRGTYVWVIGSMVAITAILVAAGALLLRMSVRELELRESKRQKELERQLEISERLGSLGILTAGVAHEINNPLEGIANYLSLLDREPLPLEKRKRYLSLVRHGFERIRDIVRDLSSFARPSVDRGTADLALVVERSVQLAAYSRELKEVEIASSGLDRPLIVPGDPGRLEQVVINLLVNAGRAMGGRGLVTIRARTVAGDGTNAVELEVEDDGPGIPPVAMDRIFDPFFSTTDSTGLGLSLSYGIVRAHGGTLSAENRREGGARFTLRLPRDAARDTSEARSERRNA